MSFSDSLRDMDAALFNEFSESAIYNDQYKISVIVDEDVDRISDYGESTVNAFEISFMRSEVPDLKRDDIVETGARKLRTLKIVSTDGDTIVMSAEIESN